MAKAFDRRVGRLALWFCVAAMVVFCCAGCQAESGKSRVALTLGKYKQVVGDTTREGGYTTREGLYFGIESEPMVGAEAPDLIVGIEPTGLLGLIDKVAAAIAGFFP